MVTEPTTRNAVGETVPRPNRSWVFTVMVSLPSLGVSMAKVVIRGASLELPGPELEGGWFNGGSNVHGSAALARREAAEKGDLPNVGCAFHRLVAGSLGAGTIFGYGVNTLLFGRRSEPRLMSMDHGPFAGESPLASGAQEVPGRQGADSSSASTQVGNSNEFVVEIRSGTAQVLPDMAVCRAEPHESTDYAVCLVDRPFQCPHALSFGWSFFCRHPERQAIVARTSLRSR